MIGFFIWCWDDWDWLNVSLPTFTQTSRAYLLGIANAPTDSRIVPLLEEYCEEVMEFSTSQSISACVNTGYSHMYDKGFEYLGWIHPDQRFEQPGWSQVLKETLDQYPHIGKISCENIKSKNPVPSIYEGAEAGNLIRRRDWKEIGPYDEAFIGCGGYEDWDIQRRFIAKGLANAVTSDAQAYHEHATTRSRIDANLRNYQWAHNQGIYYAKWNTYENKMVPDGWVDIPLARET